ncbi:MAG: hypothetical protein P4L33_00340 [Capsulimonadaceae bacterium]|nr:hypothetical protein [Capsulimonadaceae bacterium]
MIRKSCTMALLAGALAICGAGASPSGLEAQAPIELTGATGGFDYLVSDGANQRIYGSHPGANSVVVIDTKAGTAKDLNVGVEVNGIAVVKKLGEVIFAGGGGKVLVYNAKTLAKKTEVALDGPGDDIGLDPKNGLLYIDEDKGSKAWVFDTSTDKITGTVALGGVAEFIEYDKHTDKLYQNIKSTDSVQVIDPATNAVVATWSSLPAKSPHGLAIDSKGGRVFTGGRNGVLAVLDIRTGKVTGQAEIAPCDQITFDAKTQRVYTAGSGFVSVVDVSANGPKLIENVAVSPKAHTLAVDPATGDLWIAYPNDGKSYVQRLKATRTK